MVSKPMPRQAGLKMMKSLSTKKKKRLTKNTRGSALKLEKMLLMSWLSYIHELSLTAKELARDEGSKTIRPKDVVKAEKEFKRVFEESIADNETL